MKKIVPSFLIIFCVLFSCSDPKDDLISKIEKITELQRKAKIPVNPKSFEYLESADSIIKTIENAPDSLGIENIFSKAYCFRINGQLDSAKVYLGLAISKIDSSNVRKRDLNYYRHSWETDLTLESYGDVISSANKFIRLLDREKNYPDLLYAYNAIERANLALESYEKALLYNDSVQQVATETNYKVMSLITSFSRARTLSTTDRRPEAFRLLDSVSSTLEGNDVKRQFYRDYGILYYYEDDYANAVKNYKKSLHFLKQMSDSEIVGKNQELLEAYLNIAEGYVEQNNFEKATRYLDSSAAFVDTNTSFENLSFVGEIRLRINVLNEKNINTILDDYYKLVENQNKIHEQKIEDELDALTLANQKEKELITENKQQEIDNLKLQIGIGVILILVVLIIVIGTLFYRQRKLRFERNGLLLQQRLLRSQMNPHFTFNALYSIKNQIATDQKAATDYLQKFSRLLRLILENSLQNFVELELELELLEKYFSLQLMRFPDKFSYEIELKNIDDDDLFFIPPMLLQPFIENSIEHGFSSIDYKGHIQISLEKQEEFIYCTIVDNGRGLNKQENKVKNSSSIRLISDFILKTTKKNVEITDISTTDSSKTGVKIALYIPVKLTEDD